MRFSLAHVLEWANMPLASLGANAAGASVPFASVSMSSRPDGWPPMRPGGLFVAIGHRPNTALLGGALPVDEAGYLRLEGPTTASAIDGVFVAGDVHDHRYRQAVTAAGDGCRAALDAERWLAERESERS